MIVGLSTLKDEDINQCLILVMFVEVDECYAMEVDEVSTVAICYGMKWGSSVRV